MKTREVEKENHLYFNSDKSRQNTGDSRHRTKKQRQNVQKYSYTHKR